MTAVRARWFPAAAVLPDQPRPWTRCYILAADDGLHVFRRPTERAHWYSPIDWSSTSLPASDRQARNGVSVHTDAGLVVVTLGSGCRCGSLGSWRGPEWARTERARA